MHVLISYPRTRAMDKNELLKKLEFDDDHEHITHNITYWFKWEGFCLFKDRVLKQLEDGMPYEDACRIYREEADKDRYRHKT